METKKIMALLGILVLAFFLLPSTLHAEDQRVIPLDLYLIIDASEGFREARSETLAWINEQVIDRLLQEGDRLIIWSAGQAARIIYSETVGPRKDGARDTVRNLEISGGRADFSSALREAANRAVQENPGENRISYTLLVSGSAENLAPSIEGGSGGLFRWFRAEKYSRWQALVVAPNIAQKVRQAAAAYMSGR